MNQDDPPHASDQQKFPSWISPPIVTSVLILIGVLFRLHHFLINRSLRLDEAALGVEIIRRSFSDIALGLSYNPEIPTAPIGFLLVSKWLMNCFAASEFALRVVPFVVSIVSIFVFVRISQRVCEFRADLVSLGLFVLSTPLIFYSADLKHYSLDVFASVVMIWMALQFRRTNITFRRLLFYGIIGSVLFMFSFTVCFVAAAVIASGVIPALFKKDKNRLLNYAFLGVVWGITFFGVYFNSSKQIMANKDLFDMFDWALLPSMITSIEDLIHFGRSFLHLFSANFGTIFEPLALGLFVVGGLALFKQNRFYFFLLILPVCLTVGASMFQKYPFFERFLLFLIPSTTIFIGKGYSSIHSRLSDKYRWIMWPVLVGLFVFPVTKNLINLKQGYNREHTRPIIKYLLDHYQDGDAIYLNNASTNAFLFYQYQMKYPRTLNKIGRVIDIHRGGQVDLMLEEHVYQGRIFKGIKKFSEGIRQEYVLSPSYWVDTDTSQRVWLIFSYGKPGTEELTLETLDQVMSRSVVRKERESTLYLFTREK